jgi:hypothetical protein
MTQTIARRATQETIRGWYQAAIDGDYASFTGMVSDHLELHEPPFLPYGKVFHGLAGFQELFAEAAKILDLTSLAIESVNAQDNTAWAVVTVNLLHSGERATIAEQWRLEDGKVVWGRVYWFNPERLPSETDTKGEGEQR